MKCRKRLLSLVLALVIVFGLTVNASAAESITVQLRPDVTVKLNGITQAMTDANGNPVYPIMNGGTTYLPVRAVSNMLGVGVDWDGATQTVLLDTGKTAAAGSSATAKTGASAKVADITVQLRPDVTVKLDNKTQAMADANGSAVYPVMNGGTTYLPVRAVSNMLGIEVDWDGATQTVMLTSENNASGNGSVIISPDAATVDKFFKENGLTGLTESTPRQITVPIATVENIRQVMEQLGCPNGTIENAIAEFETTGPNNGGRGFIYTMSKKDEFKTSNDAKAISNAHIANDYVEVDLSTVDDGYVKVKLTKQISQNVYGRIDGANAASSTRSFNLRLNQWLNVPLPGGSDYYQFTLRSDTWLDFNVAFIATVKNLNGWTLASDDNVDFENAPKTVAKAVELCKNCKTDAEKITAVFEFITKNIKYDYKLYNDMLNGKTQLEDFDFDLDHILDNKTGICQHYAALMAGMLRSQGIPCKIISGQVYRNGEWAMHAWVSVSPEVKGLNMSQLGAGHDEDSWIRLDPTWGNTATNRAAAAVDKNHKTSYAY